MKKKILTCLFLGCLLAGCGKTQESADVITKNKDEIIEDKVDGLAYDDMKGTPTVIDINTNLKLAFFEEAVTDSDRYIENIYVFDENTKKFVQSIEEESKVEICRSNSGHLVFADINFDDNLDLHYIVDEGEGNIIFSNYVWDDAKKSFIKSDFDTKGGFEVDQENKTIVVHWNETFFCGEAIAYKWDSNNYIPVLKDEYYLGESEEMPESLINIYEYNGSEFEKIAFNEYDDYGYDGSLEWDFVHSNLISKEEVDGIITYNMRRDGKEITYIIDKDKHLLMQQ